ncbi:MAG: PAS domain S-box protein, partial [Mariprofundaceae bacterium]
MSIVMGIAVTQMNALRICLTTAVLFAFPFSVLNLTHGKILLGWVDAGMAITLCLSVWWSYHRPSLRFLENVAILNSAAFFLLLFYQGGLVDIGYVWMLGFPFIACFIAGSRIGVWYSAAFALVVAMFCVAVQQWQIEVYWEGNIIPYLLAVYLFFTVIAYLIVVSREKGENLAREAQNQLKEEAVALAESESRYKTLMDTTPNAVGVHRDGKWVYANPAAVKLFAVNSVESILGTPVMDCIHSDYHAMVIERMQIQKTKNVAMPMVEEKLLRKNGEIFTAEVYASPVIFEGEPSFLTVCQDISERKVHEEERLLLQSQLEHAQRLESLGVLAGGIAHDFNYLLAAILGNAELARM